MEWAGGRGQLGGAIALCHVDYGVGVAPSRFASITVRQAGAITSEERGRYNFKQMKIHYMVRFQIDDLIIIVLTYSRPFFGKVFLSVWRLEKREQRHSEDRTCRTPHKPNQ